MSIITNWSTSGEAPELIVSGVKVGPSPVTTTDVSLLPPPGYKLVPEKDQGYIHTVSARLNDEQLNVAQALRSTFPQGTWGEVFRWFLTDPEIGELVSRRVRG